MLADGEKAGEGSFVVPALAPLAKANFKVLGKELGPIMKQAAGLIAELTSEQIQSILDGTKLTIEVEGKVIEVIPKGGFKVELTNGHIIEAHVSGKMRMNNIRILLGDKVVIDLSPYDLTRGRITYRK